MLLIRACGARLASSSCPWVQESAAGSVWLDASKMNGHTDTYPVVSSGYWPLCRPSLTPDRCGISAASSPGSTATT